MNYKNFSSLIQSIPLNFIITVVTGVTFFLAGFLGLAAAGEYPDRLIEVVVPYGPGSNTDRVTLTVIPYLEKNLGQKILPKYKAGGGGTIGTAYVAQANPDGYTLGLNALGTIITKPLTIDVPFTVKDFVPIAQIGVWHNAIIVREDSKWKTIQNFVTDAKLNPDKYICAITGPLGPGHLSLEAIKQATGIKVKHVPFEGGAGGILLALFGKQVDLGSTELRYEYGKDGKTRVLTILTGSRVPEYPDVQTLKNLGYNLELDTWVGLVAPKGTPKNIIEKVERATKESVADPELRKALKVIAGVDAEFLSSKDLGAKWEREIKFISDILQNLGISKR